LPLVALAQQESPAISAERPEYYVIKKDDTLGGIAKRYGLDARDLATWNGIADPRRHRCRPAAAAVSAEKPGRRRWELGATGR
jgi:hypothetical protein